MANYNRRQFITRSTMGFAGASLGLSVLGQGTAQAANVGGYKALVGIMLKGGMDQNDTIMIQIRRIVRETVKTCWL